MLPYEKTIAAFKEIMKEDPSGTLANRAILIWLYPDSRPPPITREYLCEVVRQRSKPTMVNATPNTEAEKLSKQLVVRVAEKEPDDKMVDGGAEMDRLTGEGLLSAYENTRRLLAAARESSGEEPTTPTPKHRKPQSGKTIPPSAKKSRDA